MNCLAKIFEFTQIQATWILTLIYQAMNGLKLQNLPLKVRNFKVYIHISIYTKL